MRDSKEGESGMDNPEIDIVALCDGGQSDYIDHLQAEIAQLRVMLDNCQQIRDLAIGRLKAGGLEAENERLRVVVEVARLVLEWPQKKYLVQLNQALEALDAEQQ